MKYTHRVTIEYKPPNTIAEFKNTAFRKSDNQSTLILKKMFRTVNKVKWFEWAEMLVLADVIIFVYEVPCIFWHYISVDEVSLIYTLKKLLQSAME